MYASCIRDRRWTLWQRHNVARVWTAGVRADRRGWGRRGGAHTILCTPDSASVGEDANEYGNAQQEAVVPLPRGAMDRSHYLADDDRLITSYMVRCVNMLVAISSPQNHSRMQQH
jgi:hypothetical protein